MAGEYPGAPVAVESQAKVRSLQDAGVTCFIDLTVAGERGLMQYSHLLAGKAEHVRMPIQDLSVPTRAGMAEVLDLIDTKLAADETVYVHCLGGIGRTGTVVGCYLVRHGICTGDEVMAVIADLRSATRKAATESPEMWSQEEMVTSWRAGE